jgi:GntR family transcriptional regulator / MocR family aminotransferase
LIHNKTMAKTLPDAMWKQLMLRVSGDNLSLQAKIRKMLVGAILDGHLEADEAVPSSRELAAHLGVGRITVVLAYQQLADEGYLVSKERRGHFVSNSIAQGHVKKIPAPDQLQGNAAPVNWAARLSQHPSSQRSITKPANWQSYPYPFLYGQFDESLFPTSAWRECCSKALSVLDIRSWAPDQISRDDESLVHQICTRVLPRRGVWATPEELIVTVGAQHALYMVADLLMGSEARVAMEDPGYPDARNIFSSRTNALSSVPVDQHGLIVGDHLRNFDYVYTTPSHQCPTGVTMPMARREQLLKLANESNVVIIEDDFESENNFDGHPIPALKSLDRSSRVIYVGSLSKSMAPGLRIGYIVAAPELIAELRALRRLMIRHPSTFIQRSLSLFISLGHNDAQLKRLGEAQKERSMVVLDALAQYAPQCVVTEVSGGGSCWVRLPAGVDAQDLMRDAATQGVLIEPGDVFFRTKPAGESFIRLGFQSIRADVIEDGVKVLAGVIEALQQRSR